jgi:hypothetical protein
MIRPRRFRIFYPTLIFELRSVSYAETAGDDVTVPPVLPRQSRARLIPLAVSRGSWFEERRSGTVMEARYHNVAEEARLGASAELTNRHRRMSA